MSAAAAGQPRPRSRLPATSFGVVVGLLLVTTLAWVLTLHGGSSMTMPGTGDASALEGLIFTVQWGVMMAAMMLPSAAPMIVLYRAVSGRLARSGDRVIPVAMFAAVYLAAWLALGIPLYLAHVAVGTAAARWPSIGAALPYAVAAVLATAGIYQLTDAKRACLRHCESPLQFLMDRWRSGYGATLRLAAQHAGYCIGCCWGLMAILVVAGAMSIPWVVTIALLVSAEKLLPHGARIARAVGWLLILLGVSVVLRPDLAGRIRGSPADMPGHHMMSGTERPVATSLR